MNQIETNSATEQAAAWIVRLSSDQCAPGDHKQFSDWIEAEPSNGTAFDSVLNTWQKSSFASPLPATTRSSETTSGWNLGWMWPTTAIASLSCLIAAAVFMLGLQQPQQVTEQYATAIGEFERIELRDGSIIELNTNSKITVAYSDQLRDIQLLQGEAYFQVAKNKNAPFVVSFGSASVTALGTAFNIHSSARDSKVIVTEGVVAVAEADAGLALKGERAIVNAGQELNVNLNTGLGKITPSINANNTAWRKRTLVLENIPLNTALEKLSRYLKHPVDISHASLRKARVSGTFSLEQPEATLAALIESFNLKRKPSANIPTGTAYYIAN